MVVGGQTEARAQLSSTIIDYHEPFDQGFRLELAWIGGSCRGDIIEKRLMSFAFDKTRISLSLKLVPVQYGEYEYGLLTQPIFS